jgi:hypothetical protein
MKCFICERDEYEVMLLKCPVDTAYESVQLNIIGNYSRNEYVCLPCVGFQFDLEMREIS